MPQTCRMNVGDEQFVWSVERLWELARDLPVTMVPMNELLPFLEAELWTPIRTLLEIAEHAKRLIEADITYPLIMSAEGAIMDGRHRLAKAWILQRDTVDVVRFPVNPAPAQLAAE